MSLNHVITYALDVALAAVLIAGFIGAANPVTAVNFALAIYAVGFVRSVLS